MKRSVNLKLIASVLLVIITLGVLATCGSETAPKNPNIDYYTCSMHTQVRRDAPGQCPICGMDLVPVMKGGAGGKRGIGINPERQKSIGIKTGMARKKNVVKEIRTFGRVAFDPELAVAQGEYLVTLKSAPSLQKAARSRLKLLGMSDAEIDALSGRKGDASGLYLPQAGDTYWVYATLFESDLGSVHVGDAASVTLPAIPDNVYSGTVRSLDPVVDAVTRTLRARIQIENPDESLKPDTYVDVVLKADLGERLTVPKSAVLDTGRRKIVYVVYREISLFGVSLLVPIFRTGNTFEAQEITVMDHVDDDVIVSEGLAEGDTVVVNALFMVDSETQLRMTPDEHQGHVH